MTNIKTAYILGFIFLVGSFFGDYGTYTLCASIFFSAGFIMEEMNKKNNNGS